MSGPPLGCAPAPIARVVPAPIVPVDDGSSCAGGLSGGLGNLKLIVEAPPVTELVTETPLENGLSSSALGVIGGK